MASQDNLDGLAEVTLEHDAGPVGARDNMDVD